MKLRDSAKQLVNYSTELFVMHCYASKHSQHVYVRVLFRCC